MPERKNISTAEVIAGLGGNTIALVGMMGCGKTAIGRIIAKTLALPFFDADEEIEKAAGMKISDFFEIYGEAEFRAGEQKVIARLLNDAQCVLALGGGAFLSEDTRALISQQATSIWLRADVDVLYARVMRRPGKRPLLKTADPKATLIDLLEKRQPFYAKADITIQTSTASKIITGEKVIEGIAEFLEGKGAKGGQ